MFRIIIALLTLLMTTNTVVAEQRYRADWDSLDKRPMPAWFDDAKFGVWFHWGPYSVPAWAPKGTYAEWYWMTLNRDNGAAREFHDKAYGPRFKYQDFVSRYRAELFNPEDWAELLSGAGVKYIVLTAKHHDGYAMWPSEYSWNWNSADTGPHRDIVEEITVAFRRRNIKIGLYYSLYEWFNPIYRSDVNRYVDEYMLPQMKELVTRYEPDLLWGDGEWSHSSSVWKMPEFLAWLLNDSTAPKDIVINDRWGSETRSEHGGYYTSELGRVGFGKTLAEGKWEESRPLGDSFGYNRNESIDEILTSTELIHQFVDVISRGGNFLLDVGVTADGRLPMIFQDRIRDLGNWLAVNGESIYETRKWRISAERSVRYTERNGAIYAICLDWPGPVLTLRTPIADKDVQAYLLGYENRLEAEAIDDGGIRIFVPMLTIDKLPTRHAYVLKLLGVR